MTLTILIVAAMVLAIAWGFVSLRRGQPAQKPGLELSNALQSVPQQDAAGEYHWPDRYDKDNLTALVKDPNWLFCYWNLSRATKEESAATIAQTWRASWETTTPIMRIHNETVGFHWDVPIYDAADSWYFRVGEPEHAFHLELGRLLPDQSFFPVLKSNSVIMPAAGVSSKIDPEWPPLDAIWQTVPFSRENDTAEFGGSSEQCRS